MDDEGEEPWKEERLVSLARHARRYQAECMKPCAGSVSSRIVGRFQFHVKLFVQPSRFKASLKSGMHVRVDGTPWKSEQSAGSSLCVAINETV